jgi:hypothetical protein
MDTNEKKQQDPTPSSGAPFRNKPIPLASEAFLRQAALTSYFSSKIKPKDTADWAGHTPLRYVKHYPVRSIGRKACAAFWRLKSPKPRDQQ